MRKFCFTLLYIILFAFAPAAAGEGFLAKLKRTPAAESQLFDAQWFKAHYSKAEYMIPMRDGVKLYTAVYTPKNKKSLHPILLNRTPYGCEPYGKKNSSFWQDSIYHNYLEAEYIFVFQDVRGRWMSEGESVNMRPFIENKQPDEVDEASDAYDTIEWLLRKVKRHNGRVGIFGSGYEGYYALMAAASNHSAIRAISPQAPSCDWFVGDEFHRNGAFALYNAVSYLPYFGFSNRTKSSVAQEFESPLKSDNAWEFFMHNNVADITRSLNGSIPFWDMMMQHSSYDEFWQSRNVINAAKKVKVPALIVGSAFDQRSLYGTWSIYRALQESDAADDCRLVIGPWSHAEWRKSEVPNLFNGEEYGDLSLAALYRDEIEFPFFDFYLRDTEWGGATDMRALVYFSGENCWREMASWCGGESVADYTLFLGDEGALTTEQSDVRNSFSSYLSDPDNPVPCCADIDEGGVITTDYMIADQSFVEERDDVLTFTSAVLEEDMCVAGAIDALLYASISQTDADFVVKVIDVGPDGEYEMLVRGDIMRGRYRNSLSAPEAFTPDKIEKIRLSMPDVAHTFMAGHRIKVQIQSSWFPLYDRNPQQFIDIYNAKYDDFVPCEVKIYHDNEHSSSISFRVM